MRQREQRSLTLNRSLARRMLYSEPTALAAGRALDVPCTTPDASAFGSRNCYALSPDEGNQL